MPIGPGKYNDECTQLRKSLEAEGVLLIVFGGKRGEGFEAQLPLDKQFGIPAMLRDIADQIEAVHKRGRL